MFLKLVFKRKEMCMSVIFQAKINLMLVDKHSQIPILALKTPNLLVLHLNAEDQFWPWTVTGDLVQCADFLWAEDSIIRFHTINRDGNIFWGKQNNFSTNNAASKWMAWMNEWMNEWMWFYVFPDIVSYSGLYFRDIWETRNPLTDGRTKPIIEMRGRI